MSRRQLILAKVARSTPAKTVAGGGNVLSTKRRPDSGGQVRGAQDDSAMPLIESRRRCRGREKRKRMGTEPTNSAKIVGNAYKAKGDVFAEKDDKTPI